MSSPSGTIARAFEPANGCPPAGFALIILCTGATVIAVIVIYVRIVYNSGTVVNGWAVTVVVSVHIAMIHISVR